MLLLAVSFIWGSQFTFNKMALYVFTSNEIAILRSLIGMLTLSVLWRLIPKQFGKENFKIEKSFRFHIQIFVIALFEATIPFLLVPWGQQYIDSSIAAVLMGTIPIFVAMIAIFFAQESIKLNTIFSIFIGFCGIMILLLPGLRHADLFSHIIGELAILGGAFSFAISLFLIKKLPNVSPILSARNILFWASIQMLPFVFFQHSHLHNLSNALSWFSIIVLGVFCAGIVYVLYIILINNAGTTIASFSNYLVPFVGFILGIAVFKEQIKLNFIIALILIFIALLSNEIKLQIRKNDKKIEQAH